MPKKGANFGESSVSDIVSAGGIDRKGDVARRRAEEMLLCLYCMAQYGRKASFASRREAITVQAADGYLDECDLHALSYPYFTNYNL